MGETTTTSTNAVDPSSSTRSRRQVEDHRDASLLLDRKRNVLLSSSTNIVPEGVYIPPAKRRRMEQERQQQQQEEDSHHQQASRALEQRRTWEEQKRVVHGTINRLNAATIKPLIHDLFDKVNLIRMRGVLAKSVLLAAAVSAQQYSAVYAALIAVINTKLPEVGELIVKRAILAFRRYYRRRDKQNCAAMAIFLGHLFHQSVVHELNILQILTVLLDGDPTDDSVEVAVQLLIVTGNALLEVTPAGVRAVLERLRSLLHEGTLSKRVEYKVEHLLNLRKNGFRDHPPIPEELDLVESDDQITFEISLDDEDIRKEEHLDVFHVDPDYEQNESEWSKIRAEVLGLDGEGSESDGEDDTDDGSDASVGEEEEEEENKGGRENTTETAVVLAGTAEVKVQDLSEADLIHLRRTIYLTIMSSATFEECTHKLAKIDIPSGREEELINMLIECCSQEKTFLRYYGLISGRFCLLHDRWRDAFMEAFSQQYQTIHRLETNKLRNVAKLFAHLLHTDSMPWSVLSIIHLNEDETTSSSRIFIKILMQEIAEALGMAKLKQRIETTDPEQSEWYKGLFPTDQVRNTRYSINFFTSIGLGPLTDGMREYLKNAPKLILEQAKQDALAKDNSSDDSSSLSSSSSSSSSSFSSSSRDSSTSRSYSSYSSASRTSRGRPRKRSGRRRRSSSSYSSSYSSSSRSSSSSSESTSSRRSKKRTSSGRKTRDKPSRKDFQTRRGSASVESETSRSSLSINNNDSSRRSRTNDKSSPRQPRRARNDSPVEKSADGSSGELPRRRRLSTTSDSRSSRSRSPRRDAPRSRRNDESSKRESSSKNVSRESQSAARKKRYDPSRRDSPKRSSSPSVDSHSSKGSRLSVKKNSRRKVG